MTISPSYAYTDTSVPFAIEAPGISGRLLRLGPALDKILTAHAYPHTAARTLGEALALAALIGTSLNFNGHLIVQIKTEGAMRVLVADYATAGHLRGYASFDASRLGDETLVGKGLFVLTIDPGPGSDRSQGIVAIEGGTLTEAAETYFRQSEGIATLVRLAVEHTASGWQAGGLLLQDTGRDNRDFEAWARARTLASTVTDDELLDAALDPHRLLFRLLHEENVSARTAIPLQARCRCSRDKLLDALKKFDAGALTELRDGNGRIAATCEFCVTTYTYGAEDGLQ